MEVRICCCDHEKLQCLLWSHSSNVRERPIKSTIALTGGLLRMLPDLISTSTQLGNASSLVS